jgi:Raf kinase inhibitor-like YbhB/YbcL family protein
MALRLNGEDLMASRIWRGLAPALLVAALASCGASTHATNETNGGSAVENATLTKISLTSSAFQDGQPIPAQYTCDGANQSPPLSWGEPPQGTKSFALVLDDPDAPSGTFSHWGAFDIPANLRKLDAGAGNSAGSSFAQAVNGMGKIGYGGPCPPKGHGPHHYRFKLYALDVDKLGGAANPKVDDVENAAQKHLLGQAQLTGMYERR